MTVSLEMLMNEVRLQDHVSLVFRAGCLMMACLWASGSSSDCQRGPDPAHAPFEGGAEAHAGLPPPEVSPTTEGC